MTDEIENNIKNIIRFMPGAIYLKDLDGNYVSCSEYMLKESGFSSSAEVIGKTDYDLFPKPLADRLRDNDLTVIATGESLIVDECIVISGGVKRFFQAIKVPLKNDQGRVIGVLGNSIDITPRKQVESLKLETELQRAKLKEQDSFCKIAEQVVHDIRSPLASLLIVLKSREKEIPEQTRIALREAAISIGDIANNLLRKYKKEEFKNFATEGRQPIIVSLALLQILSEKKQQFKELPVKFMHDFCAECNFSFIDVEFTSFKRMMSNLINNAVDSLEGLDGTVELKLGIHKQKVIISILDNGKGMPKEVMDKILKKIAVTAGKPDGHGIGFTQIMRTLELNQGTIEISSKIGEGTWITITFPAIDAPKWAATEINLKDDDIVIVLDDDRSIHNAWDTRFKDCLDVVLKHFTLGEEAISFVNNYPNKDQLFLLVDFELLNQELNGLHVIERTKIERSMLVTSHHNNLVVRNLALQCGAKILPKPLAPEVPIKIDGIGLEVSNTNACIMACEIKNSTYREEDKNHNITTSPRGDYPKVDVVLLDDEEMLLDSLCSLIEGKGKIVDKYTRPTKLLENLSQYDKDTKIFIDNDLNSNVSGIELAKQLYDKGYTSLFLFSGKDFYNNELPHYLTAISKIDTDKLISCLI